MAGRIRSLKPELLDDESNAKLSDAAWRLWVSMRLLADDHGNVRAGDRYLAANVWQDTSRTVDESRAELVRAGKIAPYTVHGERFAHLNGWEGEQRIDNAGKPRVPRPEEDDGTCNQEVSGLFAETRRDSPRLSEKFGSRDAGARASSPPDQRSPISDLRPPTAEPAANIAAEASGSPTPSKIASKGNAPRGTRLSPTWSPKPETVQRFRDNEHVDALACLERFRNHWVAKTEGATKLDWERTFVNWVLEEIARGRASPIVDGPKEAHVEIPADVLPPAEAKARINELVTNLAKSKSAKTLDVPGGNHGRH